MQYRERAHTRTQKPSTSHRGVAGAIPAALFAAALLLPAPSLAGAGADAAGKAINANPQVTNAAGAASSALSAVATKGKATRGASGSIASLLVEADTIICGAWIITFRQKYQALVVEYGPNPTPQQQNALQKMRDLKTIVERECDDILTDYSGMQDGSQGVVGGGDSEAGEPEAGEGSDDSGFTPRQPDETIEDRICWDRCGHLWTETQRARREYNRQAGRANEAQERAREAQREYRDLRREQNARVSELRERVRQAQTELREVRQWAQQQLQNAQQINASEYAGVKQIADAKLAEARAKLEGRQQALDDFIEEARAARDAKRAEVGELEEEALAETNEADSLRSALQLARAAYVQCTQQCYAAAAAGGYTGQVKIKDEYGRYVPIGPATPASGGATQQSASPPPAPNGPQRLAGPDRRVGLLDSIRSMQGAFGGAPGATAVALPAQEGDPFVEGSGTGVLLSRPARHGREVGVLVSETPRGNRDQGLVVSAAPQPVQPMQPLPSGVETAAPQPPASPPTGVAGVQLGSGPSVLTASPTVAVPSPVRDAEPATPLSIRVPDANAFGLGRRPNLVLQPGARPAAGTGSGANAVAIPIEGGQTALRPPDAPGRALEVRIGQDAGSASGGADARGQAGLLQGVTR